jgi:hypothetical protein
MFLSFGCAFECIRGRFRVQPSRVSLSLGSEGLSQLSARGRINYNLSVQIIIHTRAMQRRVQHCASRESLGGLRLCSRIGNNRDYFVI